MHTGETLPTFVIFADTANQCNFPMCNFQLNNYYIRPRGWEPLLPCSASAQLEDLHGDQEATERAAV